MHIQCNSNPSHTFPFTTYKKVWKNKKKTKTKQRSVIDYNDNMMGVLALFINGMGPTEVNIMGCMINLPKSKKMQQTKYIAGSQLYVKKSSIFLRERDKD